jgi:membrane protease YdiL (CAAX protease family)
VAAFPTARSARRDGYARHGRRNGPTGQTGPVSDTSATPARATDACETRPAPARSPRYGLEALAVLGVSLGLSAVYALLYYVRAEVTVRGGIAATTATVVSGPATRYPWLDLADDLADVLNGLMPAALALVLLARDPGGRGLGVGLDRRHLRRDALPGAGFAALIGIPGLGLVWAAHELGINASIAVVDLPNAWYRVPLLVLQAVQNGLLEEIVVVGYLLTRLRQLGWSDARAVGVSAVLRGAYHLYQGWGGFVGNLAMGLIFGWWFQRTRRVLPLAIAHSAIDAVSFVGYVYLHNRVAWI